MVATFYDVQSSYKSNLQIVVYARQRACLNTTKYEVVNNEKDLTMVHETTI